MKRFRPHEGQSPDYGGAEDLLHERDRSVKGNQRLSFLIVYRAARSEPHEPVFIWDKPKQRKMPIIRDVRGQSPRDSV